MDYIITLQSYKSREAVSIQLLLCLSDRCMYISINCDKFHATLVTGDRLPSLYMIIFSKFISISLFCSVSFYLFIASMQEA